MLRYGLRPIFASDSGRSSVCSAPGAKRVVRSEGFSPFALQALGQGRAQLPSRAKVASAARGLAPALRSASSAATQGAVAVVARERLVARTLALSRSHHAPEPSAAGVAHEDHPTRAEMGPRPAGWLAQPTLWRQRRPGMIPNYSITSGTWLPAPVVRSSTGRSNPGGIASLSPPGGVQKTCTPLNSPPTYE